VRGQERGAHDTHFRCGTRDECDALLLFKNDIGAFQCIYSFLSQIFNYENTAIEKRFLFYRRLAPLLEFGREREGIDLSKITLTHYGLIDTRGEPADSRRWRSAQSSRRSRNPARGR